MARGLAGIVDTFGLGELPEEGMPQHVGEDMNFLCLGEMRIGLGGDTANNPMCFPARALSAGARQKEGRGVVLPCLQPKPCHDLVYILGAFSRLYGTDTSHQISRGNQ